MEAGGGEGRGNSSVRWNCRTRSLSFIVWAGRKGRDKRGKCRKYRDMVRWDLLVEIRMFLPLWQMQQQRRWWEGGGRVGGRGGEGALLPSEYAVKHGPIGRSNRDWALPLLGRWPIFNQFSHSFQFSSIKQTAKKGRRKRRGRRRGRAGNGADRA